MSVLIYHNPRCSKSRQTLELIKDAGVEPEIRLYLEAPPGKDELQELLGKLKVSASDILRKKESEYELAGLSADSSEADIIAAIALYPKLLERPIVVKGNKAVIGRPPENVMTLL